MSNIKLEVGKTYRSRKGEEVKIVGMGNKGWDYWEGSNGEWYYEGGKWSYVSKEHPNDLIEEVEEVPETSHTFGLVPEALTAIRYTFDIPDGMKKGTVSQEGNRIVVEMVPEKEPRQGDVMINNYGSVYIFKEVVDNNMHNHYAWLGKSGRLSISGTLCYPGRPATPEEAQTLWDALKKAGKRWNAETMQVEDIGPKPGDVMINDNGNVYIFEAFDGKKTHKHYCSWLESIGQLSIRAFSFPGRPATPEEAQPLWDALKKAGKRWNPETMQVEEIAERERIMDFLQRYGNNVTWNHEQLCLLIESYLKHKEGEK
jgi:hypothetical protein